VIYVKDIMTRKVRTIPVGTSVLEAAREMSAHRIGCLVIVDAGKPVGIVTEGDVSRTMANGGSPARTRLRSTGKKLKTIGSEAKVEEAARKMADAGIKKLPVIDDGRLVGIVTQTDIVRSSFDLVTALKEMVVARYRPPDFEP